MRRPGRRAGRRRPARRPPPRTRPRRGAAGVAVEACGLPVAPDARRSPRHARPSSPSVVAPSSGSPVTLPRSGHDDEPACSTAETACEEGGAAWPSGAQHDHLSGDAAALRCRVPGGTITAAADEERTSARTPGLPTARMEAFSDGVFAIAIGHHRVPRSGQLGAHPVEPAAAHGGVVPPVPDAAPGGVRPRGDTRADRHHRLRDQPAAVLGAPVGAVAVRRPRAARPARLVGEVEMLTRRLTPGVWPATWP